MENIQTGIWLDVADPQYSNIDSKRLIVKFDNGDIIRYDEEYPFAEVTHVLILPL